MMRLFAVGMALATLLISMSADADMLLMNVGGGWGGGGSPCTPGQLSYNVACNAVFHQGIFQ